MRQEGRQNTCKVFAIYTCLHFLLQFHEISALRQAGNNNCNILCRVISISTGDAARLLRYRQSRFQSIVKYHKTERCRGSINTSTKHRVSPAMYLGPWKTRVKKRRRVHPVKISTPMREISTGNINRWHARKFHERNRRHGHRSRSPIVVSVREEQTLTRELVRSVAVEFMLMIQYFFSCKDINFTLFLFFSAYLNVENKM